MHGTPRDAKPAEQTSAPAGLTVSDALGDIARRSPVPNTVRAPDRFELQVWVTDGSTRGFLYRWATCDLPTEAASMVRLMTEAGFKVHLVDLAAVTRRWVGAMARGL